MLQAADEVPAKFYKYRPMNNPELVQRVEKIVLNNEIFFPPPSSFNDPFDLKPAFSLDAPPARQRASAPARILLETIKEVPSSSF